MSARFFAGLSIACASTSTGICLGAIYLKEPWWPLAIGLVLANTWYLNKSLPVFLRSFLK